MQRLSSSKTFFYKRIFPVMWFGFIAVFALIWIFDNGAARAAADPGQWMGLFVPFVMCIVGGLLLKRLIFNLSDEVWLEGDTLVVKNRGESTRLALGEVINVNSTTMTNPPRITLTLRTESSRLGSEVNFIPAGMRGPFSAFKASPIATDLIRRIDALRRRPA